MEKRLFRNEHDKMIAGVASGLADYMQIEITIVRLLFVLSAIFMAGLGLIAYIVIWIIVPIKNDPAAKFAKFNQHFNNAAGGAGFAGQNPFQFQTQTPPNWTRPVTDAEEKKPFETQGDFTKFNKPNDTARTVIGLVLLVFGCFFMMKEFDLIPDFFRLRNFYPLILIAIGIGILAKSRRKNEWETWQQQQAQTFNNATAPKAAQTEQEKTVEQVIVSKTETTPGDENPTSNPTENPLT